MFAIVVLAQRNLRAKKKSRSILAQIALSQSEIGPERDSQSEIGRERASQSEIGTLDQIVSVNQKLGQKVQHDAGPDLAQNDVALYKSQSFGPDWAQRHDALSGPI